MIGESAENRALEAQAREEKPVTTTVVETLDYALDLFAKAEDLLYQKNDTNRRALGTLMWKGQPLLLDLPVDELLGLETRLVRLRQLIEAMPTLDATKHWVSGGPGVGSSVWVTQYPEETVKTEKIMTPVVMAPATDKHPAQVQAVNKDVPVGTFTTVKRSGAATAQQKADVLKVVDELIVEAKRARMRANEVEASNEKIASKLVELVMAPLKG